MKELFEPDFPLSELTSIGLGGNAKYLYRVRNVDELIEAIKFARSEKMRFFILGGGSNIVFSDTGFDGLVIKNEVKGFECDESIDRADLRVSSGELWDEVVERAVGLSLGGIECMSGIPGTVGATPVQNVGAYGQEVSDVIKSVSALDLKTYELVSFDNRECGFGYRTSRFKCADNGRYFIAGVEFVLPKLNKVSPEYASLKESLDECGTDFESLDRQSKLSVLRSEVLRIRKNKSMVLDSSDPDTRSCGSFFVNPVLEKDRFTALCESYSGLSDAPARAENGFVKIPSAWLIEAAGFRKGYTENGVGISNSHSLALVNRGGSTAGLIMLSEKIKTAVTGKFGIMLENEPQFIP
ncbi:MAG: UDP-N-acetylmuramate dehydrogenase [Ignavibacteria bacterium]|nr:UDP-N-acetylmuramate dehydrogenase [Ignavibacteria bacterium]